MDQKIRQKLIESQRNEITEYHIYNKLADGVDHEENEKVLRNVGEEEKEHYDFWKKYTEEDVGPKTLKVWFYFILSKLFGISFGIKLMELGEESAQETYDKIAEQIPEAKSIVEDEDEHEDELIAMLDEERLSYMGSIVRGLNDALVELTGALAGLTFVLGRTDLIAVTGLITGISASLSMGGSEYLGSKSEEGSKDPGKASFYTGLSYIVTVAFLISPYMLLSNVYLSLAVMVVNAVIVIVVFNFYMSVVKELSFRERFLEMAGISLGIAALSFVIGFVIRAYFGVEV